MRAGGRHNRDGLAHSWGTVASAYNGRCVKNVYLTWGRGTEGVRTFNRKFTPTIGDPLGIRLDCRVKGTALGDCNYA